MWDLLWCVFLNLFCFFVWLVVLFCFQEFVFWAGDFFFVWCLV